MVEMPEKIYGYVSEKHGVFYDDSLPNPTGLTPVVSYSDYAALEAKLAEKVNVKPLEWVAGRNCECSAETVVGMYEVGFDDGWWAQLEGGVTWDWEPDQDPRSYEGPGAAKAAAQADYERRILSALEAIPPAPKVTDERRTWGEIPNTRTNDAHPVNVLAGVLLCADSWVPEARIIGNVRAGDIARAIRAFEPSALSALTSSGYRILGPGELDPVTVEKCAAVAENCPDTPFAESRRWYGNLRQSIPAAIRALCATHQEAQE